MLHQALSEYMEMAGLPSTLPRSDGATLLVFDGRIRLLCHQLPAGELVLEHRLCPMPSAARQQDALLEEAGRQMLSQLLTHSHSMVLAPDQSALLLQQAVPAGATRLEFEAVLEEFLNVIEQWRLVLRLD